MRIPPQIRMLPDGRRLHLQHGPIDLIVRAWGAHEAIESAYAAAAHRFVSVLDELCGELDLLRAPVRAGARPDGPVARRMHAAVLPFAAEGFITPMAAVAGSVAEEILAALTRASPLDRAFVNNGGDIAIHLAPGERFTVGMVDRPDRPSLHGEVTLRADQPVRGVATSGWRGRSFSLGIADAVTVLARAAGVADAAATIVANAVDLPGHPAIRREPADTIQPDSDLRGRFVTRAVGPLTPAETALALARGRTMAADLVARGLIHGAALHCAGATTSVGAVAQPVGAEELVDA